MTTRDANRLAALIEAGALDRDLPRLRAAIGRREAVLGAGTPASGRRVRIVGGPLVGRRGRVVQEGGGAYVVRLEDTGDTYQVGPLMIEPEPEDGS
jgi:hypothetical protein